MKLSRTAIRLYREGEPPFRSSALRTCVSLHGHSECSRETLDFIPGIARRIPLVASLFEQSIAKYQREQGKPLDFRSVYWRPPLSPSAYVASEREHIAQRLDCEAIVSLTDHDTFEGPRKLRAIGVDVPISVEWSIRVEETVFHLGVHGIPAARLDEVDRALATWSAGRPAHDVGELLDWLNESPETLVVLNHPYWDLTGVGMLRHESLLLGFVRAHRHRIHALELNGYRRWSENRRVLPLAEGFVLPVVGGGDRHGFSPNTIVNLTGATTFAEFAAELRAGQPTVCVVFPEYSEPFAARVLQGARDALGYDPAHPAGRYTWGDRVFCTVNGEERSVASMWDRRAPLWLGCTVGVTRFLGSQLMRPVFRMTLSGEYSGIL